jgi:ATP-binding cassette subfamily C (CFTR/MRP) protein 1
MTDEVERNFFARCPPEKRPLHMREGTAANSVSSKAHAKDKDVEQVNDADNPTPVSVYDESLFKAVFVTFKRRIFGSGLLLLVSGEKLKFCIVIMLFILVFPCLL